VTEVWDTALKSSWRGAPVWVHGDISAGNLLVEQGRLCAVIDFGLSGVGDPACDLSIAWALFNEQSRNAFRNIVRLDDETWARGRGWTLWKALIRAAGIPGADGRHVEESLQIIDAVVADHKATR
jgi:aminoglycoside phosphotransferase (APT) family kinase protein